MTNTILWRFDGDRFDRDAIEAIFRQVEGFSGVRTEEPGGALIEAKFSNSEHGERVLGRLARDSDAISITDNGPASKWL